MISASSGFCSFGRETQNVASRMADVVLCGEKKTITINDGTELLKDDVNFFQRFLVQGFPLL